MATLAQISYDLLNMARGGILSDDENINIRQVEFWIHNVRAMLIRQDVDKKKSLSANLIQKLPCLDVDIVDASTCPCTVPIGCHILRTRNKIPKPIEASDKDLILKVAPIGITDRGYTLINIFRASHVGYNKYSKNVPKAFYFDGYIWIIMSSDPIEKVTVFGIFEDPTALAAYVDCSSEPCYSPDHEYPISNWMIEMLGTIIRDNNFKFTLATPTDTAGNAKTDVEPTIQRQ